jgi:hypothetical protein
MTRAVFSLALLLNALPAAAQQTPPCAKGQSVREIDPQTHVVIQKTRLEPRPASFDPLLVWTSDEPDSVMLVVMGNGVTEKYPKCFGLSVLADGQPLAVGEPRHEAETGGAHTVEYVTSDIAWAEAEKLASAKTITYKICKDEFRADPSFVCEAHDVLAAAAAWRKEQAAKKPNP